MAEPVKPRDTPTWQQVAAAVAAAAGGAAWISAIGSAVIGLQLDGAGLPTESTVALMSAEHRFVIGANYLLPPLVIGLVAFLVEAAFHTWYPDMKLPALMAITSLTLILAAAALILITRPTADIRETVVLQVLVAALVVPITLFLFRSARGRRDARLAEKSRNGGANVLHRSGRHGLDEQVAVFLSVLISAGLVALLLVRERDAEFDRADILLDDGSRLAGAYVTTTDEAAVLISRNRYNCPSISAVPRDRIARIWIGPDTIKFGNQAEHCVRQHPF
jgi:hypothetical protein